SGGGLDHRFWKPRFAGRGLDRRGEYVGDAQEFFLKVGTVEFAHGTVDRGHQKEGYDHLHHDQGEGDPA
ncbi:hypothetical protein OAG62_02460, partial [bacterium]|nr:hypothetical protein [bacterium]